VATVVVIQLRVREVLLVLTSLPQLHLYHFFKKKTRSILFELARAIIAMEYLGEVTCHLCDCGLRSALLHGKNWSRCGLAAEKLESTESL
jgi:hypothetical protein